MDFVPYSLMVESEAQEVDLAKMELGRQKGQEEDLLGSQDVNLASFFCVWTTHHQTPNLRSVTSADSEVVGMRVSLEGVNYQISL